MKTLHRRTLLRGAGGVAIALPFLDAMWPARAQAQAMRPRRFFVMTGVNGVTTSTWFPTGGEKDFTLGASMAAAGAAEGEPDHPRRIHQDAARDHRRHRARARRRERHQRLDLWRQERHRRRGIHRSGAGQRHRRRDQGQVPDHGEQGLQLSLLHRRPQAGPPGRTRPQEELRPPVHRVHRPGHHRRRGARSRGSGQRRRSGPAAGPGKEHPGRGHRAVPQAVLEGGGQRSAAAGQAPVGHPSGRGAAEQRRQRHGVGQQELHQAGGAGDGRRSVPGGGQGQHGACVRWPLPAT